MKRAILSFVLFFVGLVCKNEEFLGPIDGGVMREC